MDSELDRNLGLLIGDLKGYIKANDKDNALVAAVALLGYGTAAVPQLLAELYSSHQAGDAAATARFKRMIDQIIKENQMGILGEPEDRLSAKTVKRVYSELGLSQEKADIDGALEAMRIKIEEGRRAELLKKTTAELLAYIREKSDEPDRRHAEGARDAIFERIYFAGSLELDRVLVEIKKELKSGAKNQYHHGVLTNLVEMIGQSADTIEKASMKRRADALLQSFPNLKGLLPDNKQGKIPPGRNNRHLLN